MISRTDIDQTHIWMYKSVDGHLQLVKMLRLVAGIASGVAFVLAMFDSFDESRTFRARSVLRDLNAHHRSSSKARLTTQRVAATRACR